MPVIKSVTIGSCPTDSTTGTGRIVTYITDSAGTGTLEYSANGGVLPDDLKNDLDVLIQGNRLSYPDEFTVTPFGIDSSTSEIQITFPLPAPAYYTIIAYHE